MTREDYDAAFALARSRTWPVIDALEQRVGYAIDTERLETAARVLACPVKEHEANWQHGRVLYAMTRSYLKSHGAEWPCTCLREPFDQECNGCRENRQRHLPLTILDIGTAKGFSALCLQWALDDSGRLGAVVSVDVINPNGRERRNTIAEVDGLRTLHETLQPWPDAKRITFLQSTGVDLLQRHPARIHVAFVDGKHSGAVVFQEGTLLAARQEAGDLAIFDDVHIDGVAAAVKQLRPHYKFEELTIAEHRRYAIGVRRG